MKLTEYFLATFNNLYIHYGWWCHFIIIIIHWCFHQDESPCNRFSDLFQHFPALFCLFYDMIYLLTATGLSPGGSTHLHTIHRTTQITTEYLSFIPITLSLFLLMVILYSASLVFYTLKMNFVVSHTLHASIPLFVTIGHIMSGVHHNRCDAQNSVQQVYLTARYGL